MNKTRLAMATEMSETALVVANLIPKGVPCVVECADDVEAVQDDALAVLDDAEAVLDDAKDVQDAEAVQDNAEAVECDKKRKNSNATSVVEKKGKKTMRAWLVDGACVSKEDITCFDLQMSDPFHQLKNDYFTPKTTLQTVIVDYKHKGQKKKNMTFCFDEESAYTRTKNVVMSEISREIWPDAESNPFWQGAFGSDVLYYSGSVSGAPCSDMPPVDTIDDFIERLCESMSENKHEMPVVCVFQ